MKNSGRKNRQKHTEPKTNFRSIIKWSLIYIPVKSILILFNWWLTYYYFSHKMIVRRAGYIIKRKEAV